MHKPPDVDHLSHTVKNQEYLATTSLCTPFITDRNSRVSIGFCHVFGIKVFSHYHFSRDDIATKGLHKNWKLHRVQFDCTVFQLTESL